LNCDEERGNSGKGSVVMKIQEAERSREKREKPRGIGKRVGVWWMNSGLGEPLRISAAHVARSNE
jgi:hypothetical protein